MKISGFTYIHNAISSGYPIIEAIGAIRNYVDEIVAVDCQSTDQTRGILELLGVRVIDGEWGSEAGKTLAKAHSLYQKCQGDVIVHFEADEVFEERLIWKVQDLILKGYTDLSVYRLQVEQNFQRIRWYPESVHRVWPNDGKTIKEGHTTNRYNDAKLVDLSYGYLWDITNCFRDNWLERTKAQAELWHNEMPRYRIVPYHFMQPVEVSLKEALNQLKLPHWEWNKTPIHLPDILKPLVGVTKYEQSPSCKSLLEIKPLWR